MQTVLILVICWAALCLVLFITCLLNTGSDRKNMTSFYSYPEAARNAVEADKRLSPMIPNKRPLAVTFVSNLVLFAAALWIVAKVAGLGGLAQTFIALLVVGECINLFDYLVIDLLWWRRSPRVRFSGLDDPQLYADPRPHTESFARGITMFMIAALLAALFSGL